MKLGQNTTGVQDDDNLKLKYIYARFSIPVLFDKGTKYADPDTILRW